MPRIHSRARAARATVILAAITLTILGIITSIVIVYGGYLILAN